MRIGSAEWIAMLVRGAAEMGVAVTGPQAEQMAVHARTLLEWNRTINLTAITSPLEVAVKHCLDAIAPSAHLPHEGRLLDMGTGGGFPGIPLKILRPGQSMTLIDGSRKKINFVKHVIRQLRLPHIEAIQERAESFGRQAARQGRFQAIVSRALADLDTIVRLAMPLLAPDGKIFVYKGPIDAPHPVVHDDLFKRQLGPVETVSYRLPFLGDRRTLVIVPAAARP